MAMATAFTQQERARIKEQLLAVALRYAPMGGMRRVSVDEIAREAGISKGAFYSFYPGKEQLFLDMVETIHREMYGNADRVMRENAGLPISERIIQAIFEVYRVARERDVIGFIREEVPLMLRRLPPDTVQAMYHSDDEYIRRLIEKSKVRLTADVDTVCSVVRLLLMTIQFKDEVGGRYDEAMRHIIQGSCRQLIAGSQG